MTARSHKRRKAPSLAGHPLEKVDTSNRIAVRNARLRRDAVAMVNPRWTIADRPMSEIVDASVPHPEKADEVIGTKKNVRVHPLDFMAAHGRISESQKAAGDQFLALFDRSQIGSIKAIDYAKLKVDVSLMFDGLDVGAMEATREMQTIAREIGLDYYRILVNVIGERLGIAEMSRLPSGNVDRDYGKALTVILGRALDSLRDFYGLATGSSPKIQPFVRSRQVCGKENSRFAEMSV